jgi:CxxC motif-containing protein (DUF1111 family)
VEGTFEDGERYSLRRPLVRVRHLGYGPLASNALFSPRVAPAVVGLGVLEAIPEATLRSLPDPGDSNGDGVSGRFNIVWDQQAGRWRIGRFGWKAEQPGVHQHTAAAFRGDIGITSSLLPAENFTPAQTLAGQSPDGGSPEISDAILKAVVLYTSTLAVPARRNSDAPVVRHGERLFSALGCTACHRPSFRTGDWPELPELSQQLIWPYTDLLLHDMGEGLADGRPAFEASGQEWRTPPLWGLGLIQKVNGHTFLLHDGRARTFEEAILWHGGEASRAQEKYRRLSKEERNALRPMCRRALLGGPCPGDR